MSYNPSADQFFFEKTSLDKLANAPITTKRDLISILPQIFDPLFMLAPLILKGRLLFSKCCTKGSSLEWDSILGNELLMEVKEWQSLIPLCHHIKINRWLPLPECRKTCYIFTCGDGAEHAFGARAFLLIPKKELPLSAPQGNVHIMGKLVHRPLVDQDDYHCYYLLSKMKIVSRSLKNKSWSTQKSELKGALLAGELSLYLAGLYQIPRDNCIIALDSQAALYWINTSVSKLGLFHANVVSKILKTNLKFSYLKTEFNSADFLTKRD